MATFNNRVGYAWLVAEHCLRPVQGARVCTEVGTGRSVSSSGGKVFRVAQEAMRPAPTLAAHLTFALKHEGVELEILSRLFDVVDPAELSAWMRAEPTGQYARRAGFLYEWITGRRLEQETVI